MTSLPPAPNEPTYRGCISATKECGNGCNPDDDPALVHGVCPGGLPMQWRLGPDEAVLLLGRTPPAAVYWSITSYVMSQYYGTGDHPRTKTGNFSSWVQQLAVSCRPNAGPGRCQKFASLDQPFNHLAGGFDRPFALLLTSSKATRATVDAALAAAGAAAAPALPAHLVPLASDVVHLGTDDDSRDMLTMLMRVAYPRNATQMNSYYDSPPIEVLRITPAPTRTADAGDDDDSIGGYYTRADTRFLPRATGNNETGAAEVTHVELVADLKLLGDNIAASPAAKAAGSHHDTYAFLKPYFNTGLDCVDDGTECNGDCADSLYPISSNIYPARECRAVPNVTNHCHAATIDSSPRDHFVVFGVNHAATGVARYSSVTAYWYDRLTGLTSRSSEDGYMGSADKYLPGGSTHRSAKYLFAIAFARNCTAATGGRAHCVEIPSEGNVSLPLGADMFWIERMYVNPRTRTGPASNETIMAQVSHFY